MNTGTRTLALSGLALLTAAVAATIAPAQNAPVVAVDGARAARGKALFTIIGCSECHGTAGQGGIGPMSGPRVAMRDDLPVEAFGYFLRHPANAMPPYSEKVLSDAQVADIHAYLAGSLRPGKVADVPMLAPPR